MKKNRKNKPALPPNLPPEQEQIIEEQPKKQPFLKRLLFGAETPDLSELEAGSTTILDILSPTLHYGLRLLHDRRRKLAGPAGRGWRRRQHFVPL